MAQIRAHNRIVKVNQESQMIDVEIPARHSACGIIGRTIPKEHHVPKMQRAHLHLKGLELLFGADV